MPLEPDRLYHELGFLLTQMPDLAAHEWHTPEGQRWLGRASALVEQSPNSALDAVAFNTVVDRLSRNALVPGHPEHVQRITAILQRALARAELNASPAVQGAFIPVGEAFSAFAALSKILSGAQTDVMIVDPYADANLLTDFVVLVSEGVSIRLLADAAGAKPALAPAVHAWVQQYGVNRPLEAKLAPARSLHDRLIVIDGVEAWSLGQSFNALAARAPTSILRADHETAQLKIQAHTQIWHAATPIQ